MYVQICTFLTSNTNTRQGCRIHISHSAKPSDSYFWIAEQERGDKDLNLEGLEKNGLTKYIDTSGKTYTVDPSNKAANPATVISQEEGVLTW